MPEPDPVDLKNSPSPKVGSVMVVRSKGGRGPEFAGDWEREGGGRRLGELKGLLNVCQEQSEREAQTTSVSSSSARDDRLNSEQKPSDVPGVGRVVPPCGKGLHVVV